MGQRTITIEQAVTEYVCDYCDTVHLDESRVHVLPWTAQERIVEEDSETLRPVVVQEEVQGDPLVICNDCVRPLTEGLRSASSD